MRNREKRSEHVFMKVELSLTLATTTKMNFKRNCACKQQLFSSSSLRSMCDRTFECVLFTLKNLITPILIGITLYGSIEDAHAR